MVVYIPNPLQCSCLENPVDGGARWAAVYGVAWSRTRLKRLSSSNGVYSNSILQSLLGTKRTGSQQPATEDDFYLLLTALWKRLWWKCQILRRRWMYDWLWPVEGSWVTSQVFVMVAPDWLLRCGPRPRGVTLSEVMVHSAEQVSRTNRISAGELS